MAVLRFPDTDEKIESEQEIRSSLASLGIDYERWDLSRVPAETPPTRCSLRMPKRLKR